MSTKIITYATALTLIVLGVVGFIDSVVDDRAGPAVLFALISLGIVPLAYNKASETSVPLRRDLASWLERTAPTTGETVQEMTDRAVSRLRASFTPMDADDR